MGKIDRQNKKLKRSHQKTFDVVLMKIGQVVISQFTTGQANNCCRNLTIVIRGKETQKSGTREEIEHEYVNKRDGGNDN